MTALHTKKKKKSFAYRVAAVIIDQGHILLQHDSHGGYWFLPGGHVQPMEAAADAVVREMRGLPGLTVEVMRLLWVAESFYRAEDKTRVHELGLYFLARPAQGTRFFQAGGPFEVRAEGSERPLTLQWCPLEAAVLAGLPIRPRFFRTGLLDLPAEPAYVVFSSLD